MNSSIFEHPYVNRIREWLLENNLDLDRIEDSTRSDAISWSFRIEGIPTLIMLYKHENEYFFWLQGILAKLDNRNALLVTKFLLQSNFELHHTMKLALDPEKSAILIMMRTALDWLTEEHLKYRLDTYGKLALEFQDSLKRDYNLRSFLDGWFAIPK